MSLMLALAMVADGRDWREVATAADRERLRGWRTAWLAGLPSSHGDTLLEPDRALPAPMPPAGGYRCRVIRAARASRPVACRVEAGAFVITEGAFRPAGQLFADSDARAIFLGTLVMGDERRPMRYGRDDRRDAAGIVERIAAARWRIALPYPRLGGGTIDLIEIVPAQ